MPVTMQSKNFHPQYELRLEVFPGSEWQLEIFQIPSSATPRLTTPEYVATLKGTPLRLLEHRVLKRLVRSRIQLGQLWAGKEKRWPLDEETALQLGLLFRVLAPMRNLDRIRQVAEGVEGMSREELGYWLGMAMHRPFPRRVMAALRILLTTP